MSYINGRINVDNLDNLTNQLIRVFGRYLELEEQKKDALVSIADSLSVLAKKDASITENAETDSKNSSDDGLTTLKNYTSVDNLKEIADFLLKKGSSGTVYLYDNPETIYIHDNPETKEENVDWGKLFPNAVG